MEYVYCDQKWWYVWRIIFYIYIGGLLVHAYRQAGHVSKMSIERIAHEGDISLRLLLPLSPALSLHFLITTILVAAKYYYASNIVHTLAYMISPTLIITMIFLPKVI